MVGSIAYLPEALCIRNAEGKLDDPLDDILFRLDNIISLNRMVQENPYIYVAGKKYDECGSPSAFPLQFMALQPSSRTRYNAQCRKIAFLWLAS